MLVLGLASDSASDSLWGTAWVRGSALALESESALWLVRSLATLSGLPSVPEKAQPSGSSLASQWVHLSVLQMG